MQQSTAWLWYGYGADMMTSNPGGHDDDERGAARHQRTRLHVQVT